jgi:hypothetical protein
VAEDGHGHATRQLILLLAERAPEHGRRLEQPPEAGTRHADAQLASRIADADDRIILEIRRHLVE